MKFGKLELKAETAENFARSLFKENDKVSGVNESDLVRKLEEIKADLKSLKGSDADELG